MDNTEDSLLDVILEMLAQKMADKMRDLINNKAVYTYGELAERYSMSKDSIRRLAASGAFGELVPAGARNHLVTAAGVRNFESPHSGGVKMDTGTEPADKRRGARRDPGPI